MPAIAPNSLVLVTSGSGFIGAWVCLYALRAGYRVRTTVRSDEKGEYLKKIFAEYSGKFEYVLVKDLRTKGGFDSAVQGVEGVIHTGSPVDGEPDKHPDESFIAPAVEGTTNVLEALLAHGSAKRVVLTSSVSAIQSPDPSPNAVFTSEDWNTAGLQLYQADPTGSGKEHAYDASKVLAEKAAWDFAERKQPKFDLTTICPTYVFGPPIHQIAGSPEKLNFSLRIQWELFGGKVPLDSYQAPKGGYVDVRDVADAHVKSLQLPEAGGQRIPAQAGTFTWQDFADAVHESKVATPELKEKVHEGRPGSGVGVIQMRVDGSPAEAILGIKYKTIPQIVDGEIVAFQDYAKRGWTGVPSPQVLALN